MIDRISLAHPQYIYIYIIYIRIITWLSYDYHHRNIFRSPCPFLTPKNWCVLQLMKSQSQFTLATLHPRSHFFNRVLALRNPCRITWLAPPSKYTKCVKIWKTHRIQLKSYDTDLCCLPSLGPKSHESCPCTMQHLGQGVCRHRLKWSSTIYICTAEWQM